MPHRPFSVPAFLGAAVLAAGLAACGGATPGELVRVPVRRTVVVRVVAERADGDSDAALLRAAVAPYAGVAGSAVPLAPGRCEPVPAVAPGAPAAAAASLRLGERVELAWEAGAWRLPRAAVERGVAWQPVGIDLEGWRGWEVHAERIAQFGEIPEVVHRRERPDGGVVLWWRGEYAAADVEARVRVGEERWRCGSGPESVEIPWWLARDGEVRLAATRRTRRLSADGTLLVGEATLVVPGEPAPGSWVAGERPARPVRRGAGRAAPPRRPSGGTRRG